MVAGVGGQGEDGDARRPGLRPEALGEVEAVGVREPQVQQDEVRGGRRRDGECLEPCPGLEDAVALLLQKGPEALPGRRVVFDEEDRGHGPLPTPALPGAGRGGR